MPLEFVVVGHIVREIAPDGSARLGGTALHAAAAIARLGHPVGMVTRCSQDISLDGLLPAGVEVVRIASPQTTTFGDLHQDGSRQQTIHHVAENIEVTDVPWEWLDAPVVLLGPVVGEIPTTFATRFRRSLVAATGQGWLRRWDGRGRIQPLSPREAFANLPPIGAVFLSRGDWSGTWEDLEEACANVPILAVTLADRSARVRWGQTWHDIPSFPAAGIDSARAGDVFAAAFLVRFFETRDALGSARFAACAAALSFQSTGLMGIPERTAIEERLKSPA
jgi:sugar/nucleoside kinase (ribokinase family)